MGSYGGDLLPGCDDDWVVAERERLRRLAVEALASLADSADAAGRDAEVVEHARRLLRIDPLHERACRLLMQALTRQGERGEALRSYDRLAARLGTRARGRAGAGDHRDGRPAAARRPEECVTSALVGRTAEWRAAHDAWRAAAGGRAGVLCVAGEAGIGKSRLVEELARRVAARRRRGGVQPGLRGGRPPAVGLGDRLAAVRAGRVPASTPWTPPA